MVTGMGFRQTTWSPLLRSFAAVSLVAFLAAQTLCFIHCNLGGARGESALPSCHVAASSGACHDKGNSSSQGPTTTTTCFTLQNLVISGDAPTLVVPEFSVLCLPAPFTLALDVSSTELAASFSRQANHGDWVFTPEVSLGPAFRSLAPPFVG